MYCIGDAIIAGSRELMMPLTDHLAKILEARGLDVELLARLGVEPCPQRGTDWISIPYIEDGKIVNHKYRTISGEKQFSQDAKARKCFWNVDILADDSLMDQPLIITEGELDAISAIQSGFGRVMSVPDGAPSGALGEMNTAKYAYIDNAPKSLSAVTEIILATDSDEPGSALLHDLSLRLGRARCKWVRYPVGCKDLNDALVKYGRQGVSKSIDRAQWIAVEGIYRMSELPPIPLATPHDTGFPGLENHFKMRPGDFTVVTGIPSHGKTAFVGDIASRMASRYKWPVAIASFEQIPQLDHRRNLRTWYNSALVKDQSSDALERADKWIDERFVFIVPGEDDDVTLSWLLERCSAAVVRYGVKLVVIDPFNEMDHDRPADMSLTEYVGFCIKQFKKFSKKHQVHLIVVAHPAKIKRENGETPMPTLYDISDSAHWYNKPDVGIIVHRIDDKVTVVRIAKSRYHDTIGSPGDVHVQFIRERASYELVHGY